MRSLILSASLALALLPPLTVAAQPAAQLEDIRADDVGRFEMLDHAAGASLRGAFAGGTAEDLQILSDALRGVALPTDQALTHLTGVWSCRMIKLGGGLPIVVYQPFRCRASAEGGFEKLTGSQRMLGSVQSSDEGLIYLGTAFVAGETPPDYRSLPERIDPQAIPQFMPEVGLVEVVSPGQARILLPRPHLESDFNLLMLSR